MLSPPSPSVRALLVARLSVMKDESTSPSRQLEHGRNVLSARSWLEAGTAVDLDVSATKYSPFERPELGDWLNTKAHLFDAIVVWRLDRLVRSSSDLAKLIDWCDKQNPPKTIVSATEGFDLQTPFGRAMATIIAALGQLEADTIATRVADAHRALRGMDRWPGGRPPYGYMIVDHEIAGKSLAIDPVTSLAVRVMGEMTLEGKSQREIATRLTAKKFPTPTQHGLPESTRRKTPASDTWSQTSVGKILRSPTTQGFKLLSRETGERRIARGADGMPIRFADGIFSDQEWAAIQTKLGERTVTRERSHGAAPLLGIVFCAGCESRLYRSVTTKNGIKHSYYRCLGSQGRKGCSGFSFRESATQEVLDAYIADELADIPVTERQFFPGEDHTEQLEAVSRAMTGVRDEKDQGLYDYEGGAADYQERLTSLVEKRKALQALPQRAAAYVDEPTGESYADAYLRMSPEDRRTLLLKGNIRLFMTSLNPVICRLHVPEDLRTRLS